MAAAIASVSMATAGPVTSCGVSSYSSDRAVHMSSSASFGGMRLNTPSAAAPTSVSRSSHTLIVRASEEPSLWGRITGLLEAGKNKVSEIIGKGEKELNKATTEAKSASEDLGDKAESLKEDSQAQAEEAAEKVKVGVEELTDKVEEAVESAKAK
jgi:flagellar hook-basal body complex protein FliE